MDLIDQFAAATHDYNGISDERRKMQIRVLRSLEAEAGDLAAAGADDVQRFLSLQLQAGLNPTTLRKHLGAIRPFFIWARKQGIVTGDVVMDLREMRPPRGGGNGKGTPRPYTRKEIRWFWRSFDLRYPEGDPAAVDKFVAGRCGWRRVQKHAKRTQMLAIVSLALDGGLRRDEIFTVDIEDLHPDNTYLALWGARKNAEAVSENRAVPWRGAMLPSVSAWLDLRAKLAPGHDSPWLSLHTAAHCRKALRHRQFEMLMRKVPPGWEFHRMRHTMATEYLRAGGKVEVLQRILGHKNIAQTLAYARIIADDVVKDSAGIDEAYAATMNELRAPVAV